MKSIVGIILAAGKGKRLEELSKTPKALKTIGGKAILYYSIFRFLNADIKDIYVTVRTNSMDFANFIYAFNFEYKTNIRLIILDVDSYLDSPISDMLQTVAKLPNQYQNIFVSYCDIITNINYQDIYKFQIKKNCLATLLLFLDNSGVFNHKYSLNANGKILTINASIEHLPKYSNAGIFIIKRSLINDYNYHEKIEFDTSGGIMEKAYILNSLYGVTTKDKFFMEIGTPKNFHLCEEIVQENPNLIFEVSK